MINADKYLKDEKFMFDISKGIAEAICYDDMEHLKKITEKEIINWFTSNIKPQLTEDERVILRNISTKYWQKICRDNYGALEIRGEYDAVGFHTDNISDFDEFNHLFQFIKERRRI